MCLGGSRSFYHHPHCHCHPLNERSLDLKIENPGLRALKLSELQPVFHCNQISAFVLYILAFVLIKKECSEKFSQVTAFMVN